MSTTNEHDSRSPEQLKALFLDQRWLITRLSQDNGSYQGYLTDLAEAWKAADALTRQQISAGQYPTAFADCIRYALIHATIVGNLGHSFSLPSVYSNTANEPLNTQALRDLVSDEPASDTSVSSLEAIANIQNPRERAEALIEQIEYGAGKGREAFILAAVGALLTIQDEFWDFPDYLWRRLQPYLIGDTFSTVVALIFDSPNEVARATFIRRMIRKTNNKFMKMALDAAFAMHNPVTRAFTLRDFVDRVRGKERARIIQVLYRTAPRIEEPRLKSRILVELVGWLRGQQRAAAIRQAIVAISLWTHPHRVWDAITLMPHLTRWQRARFLKKLLGAKRLITRVETCIYLWWYLPKKTRQQAVNMALQVRDRRTRAKYLAMIAQKLPRTQAYQEAIQHIVTAILDIRNEDLRRATIADVREYVQDEAIDLAASMPVKRLTPNVDSLLGYRFAFAQTDPQYIAYALGSLSSFVSESLKALTLPLMVDLALEIYLHDYVAEAVEGIAPYLDEEHLGKALEGAFQIGEPGSRVWALSGLLPYLTGEHREVCLREALEATGFLDDEYIAASWGDVDSAARLLPSLTGNIREHVLGKGLSAAQAENYGLYDSRIRFLGFVDSEIQSDLAMAILRDVSGLPDESARSWTLNSIAAYLPVDEVATAIQTARALKDDYEREGAVCALIPRLPNIETALELTQTLEDPYRKSGALIALVPRLNADIQTRILGLALETIEEIAYPGYRLGKWLDVLPFVEDQSLVRQKIIEAMLDYLWSEKDNRRNHVLALCASNQPMSEKILTREVLTAIGEHVMQICLEWKW